MTPVTTALALERIELEVNGTPTVVLTAGPADAPPLGGRSAS